MKKAVILAAGMGSRIQAFTINKPKCLIKVKGKEILERQIEVYSSAGINQIIVVTGYLANKIKSPKIIKIHNDDYQSTNMLYSLMCAKEFLNEDLIVSYGDIVFKEEVLHKLINSQADATVVSDKSWLKYWKTRFDNPLEDAESFEKYNECLVKSLGDKAKDASEVQGQYIGLMKFSKQGCENLINLYNSFLNNKKKLNNKLVTKAYMTDILNVLSSMKRLSYVEINRGWFEIDTEKDLEVATSLINW